MSDLIDREMAIKAVQIFAYSLKNDFGLNSLHYEDIKKILKKLPSVQPEKTLVIPREIIDSVLGDDE